MSKFIVRGKNALRGTVGVDGSKNAALPVIFAALSLFGSSRIVGLPDIGDVNIALRLIEGMGATVTKNGGATVINTEHVTYKRPDPDLVSRLRASTYLIGACLSRFGRVDVGGYGGCAFCPRPIDYHLAVARDMGAILNGDLLTASRLLPAVCKFPRPSVGATVNFLILAASIDGESHLANPAREPHIDTLIEFLRSAGAYIERDDHGITVRGGTLHGGEVVVRGDAIEAGTFLSASLITGGEIRVLGADVTELSPFLSFLRRVGATVNTDVGITVSADTLLPSTVIASAYPGFPTDLGPITAPLLASFSGGRIFDRVWVGRYGYLSELSKLGVSYVLGENGARILPSRLSPGSAVATDLRGGAACILAALGADGYSEIHSAETILRGYANLDKKLLSLGADVEYSEI